MKSFSSKIILTFLILVIFVSFVFSFFNVLNKQKVSTKIMEENLENLVHEKRSILDLRMKQIELEVEELAYWLKKYEETLPVGKVNYIKHSDGTYREYGEKNNISLFINNNIQLTEAIKSQIFYTKHLESNLKRSVNKNSDIVCTYNISKDGILRVYPPMHETEFNSEYDFRTDHYFKYAIEKSNGKSKAIWTRPYYDWAGRGLVVTCAYPIYSKNNLESIIFADVTLLSLQEEIANFNSSEFGYSFLISNNGEIIYHPDFLENNEVKGEELKKNIFFIWDNDNFNSIAKDMISGKTGQRYYFDTTTNSTKFITFAPVESTNWSLAYVINANDYSINIQEYLGTHFIGPLIIVLIFSGFIYMTLRRFSNYLIELSYRAKELALGKPVLINDIKGGNEIETIANSLSIMNSNINNHMNNLIKTNTKLEAIFDSMKDILFVIDKDYKIVNINSLGKDIVSKNYDLLDNGFCFDYFKKCSNSCAKCAATKTLETGQESFQEIIWNENIYHIKTYPIFNSKGNVEEVVVYSTIETERIMIEREFYQREKLASIGQVSAAITHELRNPIAIISGSNYLLKDMLEDIDMEKEVRLEFYEIFKEIDDSIFNSRKIIDGLLDFSKQSIEEMQKVNIISLLDQLLLLYKKIMAEYKITSLTRYSEKAIYISGNLDSLRLVFINLIDNALYEMKNGGTLTIEIKRLYDDNLLSIIIKDTGKGMDEKTLSQIFKPFYTSKPGRSGTGIGMWLVQREVKRNQGTIKVHSCLGKGTKVEILFNLYNNLKGGNNV